MTLDEGVTEVEGAGLGEDDALPERGCEGVPDALGVPDRLRDDVSLRVPETEGVCSWLELPVVEGVARTVAEAVLVPEVV